MVIYYEKTNPMVILKRTDIALDAKGLYCLLLTVHREGDETDKELIKRCCSEPDFCIQNALDQLIEKELLPADFPIFYINEDEQV